MKVRWKTKALGDVCEVVGGGTPSKAVASYYSGDIPWATVRDMKTDFIEDTECHITADAVRSSATNVILGGNVIIATRVGLGKVCVLGQDTAINQDLRGIIPRNGILKVRFLYHWLRSVAPRIVEEGTGATVQGVKLPFIKSLQMPLPSIPEQERITAVLDEAFCGIATATANAETNLKRASSLLSQELSALVLRGDNIWKSCTLGSAVRFIDYRGKTPKKTASGLPLITAKNVRMGYIKDEPREFVAPESYEKWMRRGIPKQGDVLFTTEAPLANVAQLDTSERVVFAQRIIIMQPDPQRLDSTFLKFLLLSPPIQKRIHEKGTGATATGIKATLLKTIPIAFPPLVKEQIRLSRRLTEVSHDVDRLTALYVQKLDALDALKQSLLHQAFSGNL